MSQSIDELMWLIVDEGDLAAIDSFCKRHPEHHDEVLRRLNLVRGFRELRPGAPVSIPTPRFSTDRGTYRGPLHNRWIPGLVGAALMSLCFGSYFVAQDLMHRGPMTPIKPVSTNSPTTQSPNPDFSPKIVTPPQKPYDPNQNLVPPPQPRTIISAKDRPISLQGDSIDLISALNEITRQSGLQIEIAPGFSSTQVTANFQAIPAIVALKELGDQVGFTVFEQTENSVLVIPAVDPNQPEPVENSGDNAPIHDPLPIDETPRTDIPTNSGNRLPGIRSNEGP